MVEAPASEQLRLLDLQAIDSKLTSLKRRTRAVTENPEIASMADKLARANSQLVAADTEVSDTTRALTRAEEDVATVVTRLERNQSRLESGAGNPKDLSSMQHEVESLKKRRIDLEDAELEVMERLESARTQQGRDQDVAESIKTELTASEQKRDAELADIDVDRKELLRQRGDCAATFDAALLALYEKSLAHRGIGAARLFHGRSEGSGMQLSPGDLADIRKADPDDVLMCPDSGCILVRSEDWGN